MIGVLPLHEGSSVFHAMFSFFSRLQCVGKLVESLVPLPLGPRHCGQLSFAEEQAKAKTPMHVERIEICRRAAITTKSLVREDSAASQAKRPGASCPINHATSSWL